VVFEVLSPSTRRVDWEEKRGAYVDELALQVYLLVEQDAAGVTVYRRAANGFGIEQYSELSEDIALPEIDAQLSLAQIYKDVL
jgi:Uma2 family endonuclease